METRGASPRAAAISFGIGQHHLRRLIREGAVMRQVQDGAFNAGISKTESAAALQGYTLPTDPIVQHGSKSLPIPACHPHMQSDPQRSVYDPESGRAILDQATAETGGPDHPANMKRAVLPQAVDEQ